MYLHCILCLSCNANKFNIYIKEISKKRTKRIFHNILVLTFSLLLQIFRYNVYIYICACVFVLLTFKPTPEFFLYKFQTQSNKAFLSMYRANYFCKKRNIFFSKTRKLSRPHKLLYTFNDKIKQHEMILIGLKLEQCWNIFKSV